MAKPHRRLALLELVWWGLVALALALMVAMAFTLLLSRAWYPLALLGVVVLVGIVLQVLRRRLPGRIVLELDLERGLVERTPTQPVGRILASGSLVLREVVEGLERAAADPRVRGLVARMGGTRLGLAQAQELRQAVRGFRERGKRAVAFAETFGEGTPGSIQYYLASAFDEVYLMPVGELGLLGLARRQPFLRRLLDRWEVVPRLDHRREYKAAMYTLTEEELVEPHRRQLELVLQEQLEQLVEGIAEGRRLEPGRVRELVDRGPLLAVEAQEAGLVDGLAYRDQVYERMKAEGRLLFVDAYRRRAGRPRRRAAKLALIYGVGAVVRGRERFSPLTPRSVMASDSLAAALRAAVEDRGVQAIVIRIDSPGGSAVGSEAIWREVVRARQAGKPVVVSMGDLAASGGYYLAAGADRIVAQPGTITGSIGVVSGKLVTRRAWERAGVTWGELLLGENAGHWSPLSDFTPAGWERLQAELDAIYEAFKARVAEGRALTPERVEELAKGRIWSGAAAAEHGLVDELGGLSRAVELAKEVAGIPRERAVRLQVFPRPRRMGGLRRRQSSEDLAALLLSVAEPAPLGGALLAPWWWESG